MRPLELAGAHRPVPDQLPLSCDRCGRHRPLYDAGVAFICGDCLWAAGDEKTKP